MNNICQEVKNCRMCGGCLETVIDFGETALANNFLLEEELHLKEYIFPLCVGLCNCGSLQLKHTINPNLLFKNYFYQSSTNVSFRNHFKEYAKYIKNRFSINYDDIILEIGSNDNILLKPFRDLGIKNLYGIEPAKNLVDLYGNESDINIICDFFNEKLVKSRLKHLHNTISVICANNVYCHMSDIKKVTECISLLLKNDGIFVFEVAYSKTDIEKLQFDKIYHEHIWIGHSVKPLQSFLKLFNLVLFDVEVIDVHGGSIRCFVKKNIGKWEISNNVSKLFKSENDFGLYNNRTYINFCDKIQEYKTDLLKKLNYYKSIGKTIWAFGAPAKLCTFFSVMGINKYIIDYVVDDSPLKQNKFTPQSHIKIVSRNDFLKSQPDYCLITAWNFADSIINNNIEYKNNWIIPFKS